MQERRIGDDHPCGGGGDVHRDARAAGPAVSLQPAKRHRVRGGDADLRLGPRGCHAEAADDDPLRPRDRHARDARARLAGQREVRRGAAAAGDRDGPVAAGGELDRVTWQRRGQCRGQIGRVRHAHRACCGRARCQGGGEQQQRHERRAPHSVPYIRSPASPSPGTMKPTSLSRSSSAATQTLASGCSSRSRAMPSGAAIKRRERDVARARLTADADRVRGRAAGREHRVEHQHAAAGQPVGQLEVVRHGPQRLLVALDADEADGRVRHQLERGVEHAEPGAQDGHDRQPEPGMRAPS